VCIILRKSTARAGGGESGGALARERAEPDELKLNRVRVPPGERSAADARGVLIAAPPLPHTPHRTTRQPSVARPSRRRAGGGSPL
jgi:hypothetical protein